MDHIEHKNVKKETITSGQPMVSVVLLTYNHEEYIRQCLDSILMQKVSFKYEVVVGDDCSIDSTQSILSEYEKEYPGVFNMILREKNIGATRNLYDVLKRCKGKYLAGIEGDDYWVDENKLQIQFDFLESHEEYIGCSHDVIMIDEIGQEKPLGRKYFESCHWIYYKEKYTFEDFKHFEKPGQASSWFYRNIYLNPKYDYSIIETADTLIADTTVMMLISAQGDWYYMKGKRMACYRFITTPDKGSWASMQRNENLTLKDYKYFCNLEEYAKTVLDKEFEYKWLKFRLFHRALNEYRFCEDKEKKEENHEILKGIWALSNHKLMFIILEVKARIMARINRRLYLPTIRSAVKNGELYTQDPILMNSSWKKFRKESKNKTIVIFSGGASCREFIKVYGRKYEVPVVLDNNVKSHGLPIYLSRTQKEREKDIYDFAIVVDPNEARDWDMDRFVVLITSSLYQNEIAEQLKGMGFHNYFSFGIMESKKIRYRVLKQQKSKNYDY